MHLTHAINALLLKQKRAQPAIFSRAIKWPGMRLVVDPALKIPQKMGPPSLPLGRSALARRIRACCRYRERTTFVSLFPLPPPLSLPTSTHNLLYSRSACMADGSSLLRLLPVVARMVLARHKRVFRAHPTQYAKMLYIM